jgi:apolipoprotein N-acyltransferase
MPKVNSSLIQTMAPKKPLQLLLLGALSALAMPPLDLWWVLFITIPLVLAGFEVEKQSSSRRIFGLGWCFGFGYFLAALHWIAFAFFINPNDIWMMPIALGALAGGMALFWAAAILASMAIAKRGFPLYLVLPVCMGAFEWLRGNILTGFPWAVFGQAADGMGAIAQLASVIGMTGLTLLIWLWAAAPVVFFSNVRKHKIIAAIILLVLPLAFAWGQFRLTQNPTTYAPNIMLRLVQPNISQSDKWREGNARPIFDQLKTLTSAPSSTGQLVTHIIWPESAVPFLIDESSDGKAELKAALKPNQILMTGAVRRQSPRDDADYFTSVLTFNDQAEVIGTYDKWHLVPGGEFLPLAWLLEPLGLRKVVNLPGSFKAGKGPSSIEVPGLGPVGMSVCYEAIFPGALYDSSNRPNLLVNVTNDGWFGNSAGPYQHLAQLRLRAIESGLPVARAANTGISAIIDPLGREVFASQLNTTGNFDVVLPKRLEPTFFEAVGNGLFFFILFLLFALGQALKKM